MTEPTDAEIVAFAIETGMRVRTVSQLNAVDGVAVIDGSEAGPYPLKHHLQAQAAYDAITREPTHE